MTPKTACCVTSELRKLHPPKFDDILPAVAARLPKDGALIEILMGSLRTTSKPREQNPWLTPYYLVLVMTADQHIEVKDLGEATIVNNHASLLSALRGQISSEKDKARALPIRF